MAAVGRADETIVVNDNVYDNNAKEITPAMVRAVLAVLIESSFNLVDDELMNLYYSTGVTLADKFTQGAALASGTIDIGNATSQTVGSTFTVTGDFASATVAAVTSGADQLITVVFTEELSTNNYMPFISKQSNRIDYDDDNDLIVDTFKAQSTTSFQIAIRKLEAVTTNVKLYVKIFAM